MRTPAASSRDADRFRSSFDPEDQTLAAPAAAASVDGPRPGEVRRHRNRPFLVVSIALLAAYAAVAFFISGKAETDTATRVFLWGVVLLPCAMLAGALLTYLDVGPDGLRTSTLLRRQRVAWSELHEVRWRRGIQHDVLLLVTKDGREVKVPSVFMADTGQGKERAARVLADIQQTWAGV